MDMSKHHTTHKSAEARELATERRVTERERQTVRQYERNVKLSARAIFGAVAR